MTQRYTIKLNKDIAYGIDRFINTLWICAAKEREISIDALQVIGALAVMAQDEVRVIASGGQLATIMNMDNESVDKAMKKL